MPEQPPSFFPDFGSFGSGFDFLKNLQAASAAGGNPSSSTGFPAWLTPSLNVEELEKRIQELKSVQFWLDQNASALKTTIQAMEVQKMTLETLASMNIHMNNVAQAFQPQANPTASEQAQKTNKADETKPAATTAQTPGVDPMPWWNALSQQFQTLAQAALQPAMPTGNGTPTSTATKKTSAPSNPSMPVKAASGNRNPQKTQTAQRASKAATSKKPPKKTTRSMPTVTAHSSGVRKNKPGT